MEASHTIAKGGLGLMLVNGKYQRVWMHIYAVVFEMNDGNKGSKARLGPGLDRAESRRAVPPRGWYSRLNTGGMLISLQQSREVLGI